MEQMSRPDAPFLKKEKFGQISSVFFRRFGDGGRIFYAWVHGLWVFSMPVLSDGSVARHSSNVPHPNELVEVIDPKELEIAQIKWADDGSSA